MKKIFNRNSLVFISFFFLPLLFSLCRNAETNKPLSSDNGYGHPAEEKALHTPELTIEKNDEVPVYAYQILAYIRTRDKAPKGYAGGRIFYNREKRLPGYDQHGKPVRYREWDVHPHIKGHNRGPERLITSPESAYYTKDHYKTFIQVKETYPTQK